MILESLEDLKASDILSINLNLKSSMADYMILASGNSSRHIGSISQNLIEKLKTNKIKNISVEGLPKSDWVLLDAGDIIIHLFKSETREFYNLEKMWMKRDDVEDILIGNDT